ncbi:MAG: hypothetical protein P8Z79_01825 [Sedimentisphaerales bacterium]
MTKRDCIGLGQVDVERAGILNKKIALTRIEKKTSVAVFDPERQAVLSP